MIAKQLRKIFEQCRVKTTSQWEMNAFPIDSRLLIVIYLSYDTETHTPTNTRIQADDLARLVPYCNDHSNSRMVIDRSLVKSLLIASTLVVQGCAYTAVSTASYITTGKSIGDHATSTVTSSDCNMTSWVLDNEHHSYYCEQTRDVSTTYNRNAF